VHLKPFEPKGFEKKTDLGNQTKYALKKIYELRVAIILKRKIIYI